MAAKALKLVLRGDQQSVLTAIVAADEKLRTEVTVVRPTSDEEVRALVPENKLPALVCPEGILDAPQTIARHLARVVKGSTLAPKNTDTAMVDQWLSLLVTEFEPSVAAGKAKEMMAFLFTLNNMLQPFVFLTSGKLTFVDVFYYGALHPILSALPAADRLPLASILRYFDNIQHILYTTVPAPLQAALLPRIDLGCYAPVAWPPRPEIDYAAALAHHSAAPAGEEKRQKKTEGKGKPTPAAPAAEAPAATSTASSPAPPAEAATPAATPAAAPAAEQKPKKEKAPKKEKEPKEPKAEEAAPAEEFGALDIRVGHVVKVERHPNADTLYVEQIDVGEAAPRTIVSGLVNFVPVEQFQGAKVCVLCNLKPKEMRGVPSAGMVLCGHDEPAKTKVELIRPPADAPAGTRMTVEGIAPEEVKILGPKVWPHVQPEFHTDAAFTVTYKKIRFLRFYRCRPVTSGSLRLPAFFFSRSLGTVPSSVVRPMSFPQNGWHSQSPAPYSLSVQQLPSQFMAGAGYPPSETYAPVNSYGTLPGVQAPPSLPSSALPSLSSVSAPPPAPSPEVIMLERLFGALKNSPELAKSLTAAISLDARAASSVPPVYDSERAAREQAVGPEQNRPQRDREMADRPVWDERDRDREATDRGLRTAPERGGPYDRVGRDRDWERDRTHDPRGIVEHDWPSRSARDRRSRSPPRDGNGATHPQSVIVTQASPAPPARQARLANPGGAAPRVTGTKAPDPKALRRADSNGLCRRLRRLRHRHIEPNKPVYLHRPPRRQAPTGARDLPAANTRPPARRPRPASPARSDPANPPPLAAALPNMCLAHLHHPNHHHRGTPRRGTPRRGTPPGHEGGSSPTRIRGLRALGQQPPDLVGLFTRAFLMRVADPHSPVLFAYQLQAAIVAMEYFWALRGDFLLPAEGYATHLAAMPISPSQRNSALLRRTRALAISRPAAPPTPWGDQRRPRNEALYALWCTCLGPWMRDFHKAILRDGVNMGLWAAYRSVLQSVTYTSFRIAETFGHYLLVGPEEPAQAFFDLARHLYTALGPSLKSPFALHEAYICAAISLMGTRSGFCRGCEALTDFLTDPGTRVIHELTAQMLFAGLAYAFGSPHFARGFPHGLEGLVAALKKDIMPPPPPPAHPQPPATRPGQASAPASPPPPPALSPASAPAPTLTPATAAATSAALATAASAVDTPTAPCSPPARQPTPGPATPAGAGTPGWPVDLAPFIYVPRPKADDIPCKGDLARVLSARLRLLDAALRRMGDFTSSQQRYLLLWAAGQQSDTAVIFGMPHRDAPTPLPCIDLPAFAEALAATETAPKPKPAGESRKDKAVRKEKEQEQEQAKTKARSSSGSKQQPAAQGAVAKEGRKTSPPRPPASSTSSTSSTSSGSSAATRAGETTKRTDSQQVPRPQAEVGGQTARGDRRENPKEQRSGRPQAAAPQPKGAAPPSPGPAAEGETTRPPPVVVPLVEQDEQTVSSPCPTPPAPAAAGPTASCPSPPPAPAAQGPEGEEGPMDKETAAATGGDEDETEGGGSGEGADNGGADENADEGDEAEGGEADGEGEEEDQQALLELLHASGGGGEDAPSIALVPPTPTTPGQTGQTGPDSAPSLASPSPPPASPPPAPAAAAPPAEPPLPSAGSAPPARPAGAGEPGAAPMALEAPDASAAPVPVPVPVVPPMPAMPVMPVPTGPAAAPALDDDVAGPPSSPAALVSALKNILQQIGATPSDLAAAYSTAAATLAKAPLAPAPLPLLALVPAPPGSAAIPAAAPGPDSRPALVPAASAPVAAPPAPGPGSPPAASSQDALPTSGPAQSN
ncbi:putative aminoacyl tRNA synthase complex-interacting multifunctional protein 1 [Paratrimastix pyriformis]|uniref:Aminoacyl tRNA synthase complex-interacting multifunctional protein 1 n=1 Tax=Paratrimastix pyriformis TaxID=342808 RepID=A0ABQ8UN33_9EUKA|nr:putative aminoacyl tRNA synthase complex-interacting multifunctional protein 1 [Paratrimastix pyriformis]